MKRGLVLDEKKFYVELAHILYQKHFFFFFENFVKVPLISFVTVDSIEGNVCNKKD
jgi:hypothetical protein